MERTARLGLLVLRLIGDIWVPLVVVMALIVLSIANFALNWQRHLPPMVGLVYFIVRVAMVALAGYLATYRTRAGLAGAAVAGALVLFAEQIVYAAWFAANGDWTDVSRIAQLFVVVVWATAIIGMIGGLVGRSHRARGSDAD